MTLRAVGIVYRKELLDSLRDRRTIISMIVVPVLVMPLLMMGMGTMAARLVSKARQEIAKVMVLGGDDSPKTLAALRASKSAPPSSFPKALTLPCGAGRRRPCRFTSMGAK